MKNTKYFSNIQEKNVAKALNGSQVGGSGASAFSLGDVRTDYILVECKTSVTPKESYSVKKDVLQKISKEAKEMRKFYSALAFNFGPGSENYYVISEDMMQYLAQKLAEDYK